MERQLHRVVGPESGRLLTGVSLMAGQTYRLDEPEEHKPQLAH